MAEASNKSSDVDVEDLQAQHVDGASTSPRQNGEVHRLRRHLSRVITQPRGLFESVVDVFGPISERDFSQAEASQVNEAYRSLCTSCSSDTDSCSSYEDGHKAHTDSAQDRQDGTESREGKDCIGHNSRSRRRHESQKRDQTQNRSNPERAKNIHTRRTGSRYRQRNLVLRHITLLESRVGELQLEVSNLSPQVILLDQHRWTLQKENEMLKKKIVELSRYQLLNYDQCSVLQEELQLLRIQRADHLEQAERQQQDAVPSPEHGHPLSNVEQPDLPDKQRTEEENARGQEKAASLSSMASSLKEPQAEGNVPIQLSLVRWPSSLYRSVYAIRKDEVEVTPEDSTIK